MKWLLLVFILLFQTTSFADGDSQYPAGDVFYFQFLDQQDQIMLQADYQNFLPTLQRLSRSGFRVVMNWRASILDLKAALKNTRPTIIIWSSHGQPKGITDKMDEDQLLPRDFFQEISPTVYQFIVATCFGTPALQNYDLTHAQHVKFQSWDYPINTDHLKTYLSSWDFLDNYPKENEREGFVCRQKERIYQLVIRQTGQAISNYEKHEDCLADWSLSHHGMVCTHPPHPQNAQLFDALKGHVVKDSAFMSTTREWCREAPSRAYRGLLCYMNNDYKFSVYNLKSRTSEALQFPNKQECYNSIWSQK
jgi:hypothetical protein